MATDTRTTTDHDEIRRWVEEHDGNPAKVRGTGKRRGPRVLHIDFPGGAVEDALETIAWEEWFEKLEESELAFLYQAEKASGEDYHLRQAGFSLSGTARAREHGGTKAPP